MTDQPRIVLVGNGPSVLRRKLGVQIDLFDEVIRFNAFPWGKYADHVGSKTTCWVRNERHPYGQQMPAACQEVRVMDAGKVVPLGDCPVVPRRLAGFTGWPSSGLCMLYHLIGQAVPCVLYGFDAYEGPMRRYWSDEPVPPNDPHDQQTEGEWLVRAVTMHGCRLLEDVTA